MTLRKLIRAGLLGVVLTAPVSMPAHAQGVLRMLNGATSSAIHVSVNRAIVMESDRPFAELSVANPGIADIATLSDRTIYVLGKSPGRTTLTLLGPDANLIANIDVRVTPDIAEFKERLSEILPKERIEVRTANDGIVLSGRVSGARTLARALELAERYAPQRVTNLMVVGGSQQVMLKVRFAEMSRRVSKKLSTSIGLAGLIGADVASVNTGDLVFNGTGGTFGGAFGSTAIQGGSSAFTFGIGGVAVDLLIEALEAKGMVRTLAEPNLVAISGQEADFLAGGEYPIPVRGDDGEISIEYKPFGVQLLFKPTVIDGDLINLEIGTIVSSVDPSLSVVASTGGLEVAAFTVRRANTTVEMRDGQSFVIAGLLQDDFSDLKSQVPWLGDIPILGALFRSSEFQREQTELVIIVTPHLVVPTDGNLLALPTDRMRIPTEIELFLHGRVEGRAGVSEVAQQGFQGSYGYVME